MTTWDPDVYGRYKAYRDRPALDLLVQIPSDLDPRTVWDLGCGTGEHAALLAARHPSAQVFGLDSSPEMLAVAQRRAAAVTWALGSIAEFDPGADGADLIFSNAALQWLEGHAAFFPRLSRALAPGGVMAVQMPAAFDSGWHAALRETAASGPWAGRMGDVRGVRPVAAPGDYYDWLSPLCAELDIWTTTYLHALEGDDPVIDWMSGTGLRPYLDLLPDADEQAAFLDAYRARLAPILPARADGVTLFAFPRLFILARRGS